ncbi:nitrite reductase [Sporomusa acidovorans]|uniref:Nitrite reductase [NAD(P)H] n=1 Tax=Sporomusa acidovorans (strain ATCC 49682 / DSM 3132 / Mol) TaxID=1123286 RepID=A0ABZ3JBB1_SPOA4|nr:nitrite reductase [Sporomusa acidovorans]OZC13282.1 nitrite reductase [Sporomusa acidovorans DSM 3132]SDD98274.1 Nitrite and sulphite reductase 4Fe-4S domain-containing protein [Sporomusa acidovorans]
MTLRSTLPLAPYLPGGLVAPAQLYRIAEIGEKYGATIKLAGNSIVILGLSPEDRALALAELGLNDQSLSAKAIRSVAICAGKPFCPRALQDSTALGLALEDRLYGTKLPGKLRIGVSGCPNACSEIFIKDIGLYGVAAGYTLVVGGSAGRNAQAGRMIANKVPSAEVLSLIGQILDYYKKYGQPDERLGELISRRGFEDFAVHLGAD